MEEGGGAEGDERGGGDGGGSDYMNSKDIGDGASVAVRNRSAGVAAVLGSCSLEIGAVQPRNEHFALQVEDEAVSTSQRQRAALHDRSELLTTQKSFSTEIGLRGTGTFCVFSLLARFDATECVVDSQWTLGVRSRWNGAKRAS